ncbi:MAG: hypothetical protein JJE15_04020 [Desulfobacteraceae bacterium]|nr:hypothetical protein [Desulfobacteraceae bacterium]
MNATPTDFLASIKRESERAIGLSQRLLQATALDGTEISRVVIPADQGIYLWRVKKGREIVYVGTALEEFGLRRAIEGQDLMSIYQKSIFRNQLSSEYRLNRGKKAVKFILANFTLAYLPCPDQVPVTILLAQLLLIGAFRPRYNTYPYFPSQKGKREVKSRWCPKPWVLL